MRLVALGALAVAVAATGPAEGAPSARVVLPDLGVAPIRQVLISTSSDGTRLLRFTTSIANVGPGPIEVVASRPSRDSPWVVSQRIWRTNGFFGMVETPARLGFNGSPTHGHWHILALARYELRRLDKLVRVRVKRGFCLYDSTSYRLGLPRAPKTPEYSRVGCGSHLALRTRTGISVGWKDDYYWRTAGQSMDITGFPAGRYRLFNRVDMRNWFRESNEQNNVTWVDLEITQSGVKVVGHSPRL